MPYFAPDAPIPITSCAPRLAEMNASPQIHAGSDRPAWKKSLLVFMKRFSAKPMPSTKTKYNSMISQSTNVRFNGFRRHLPQAKSRATYKSCHPERSAAGAQSKDLRFAQSRVEGASIPNPRSRQRNPNVRGFRIAVHKLAEAIHTGAHLPSFGMWDRGGALMGRRDKSKVPCPNYRGHGVPDSVKE